jgi:hypothetical protein
MRERNDDKHDYREREQDSALGRRRIRIRNQQFPYQTVEELHAALGGDAAHCCARRFASRPSESQQVGESAVILSADDPKRTRVNHFYFAILRAVDTTACDRRTSHDCIKTVKNEAQR